MWTVFYAVCVERNVSNQSVVFSEFSKFQPNVLLSKNIYHLWRENFDQCPIINCGFEYDIFNNFSWSIYKLTQRSFIAKYIYIDIDSMGLWVSLLYICIAWLSNSVNQQTWRKVVVNLKSNLESNSFGQFIPPNNSHSFKYLRTSVLFHSLSSFEDFLLKQCILALTALKLV